MAATSEGPTIRERAALILGRAAGTAARRFGRGGGTALPGLVAGALAPSLLERLAQQAGQGVVTITGTNGKTTTTHLIASIMRAHGVEPLTNPSGSNLERGLVVAYVEAADADGRIAGAGSRVGVFEVDEAVLARLFPRLKPRVAVFLNLFRDQLDRYGEVDSVGEGWGGMLASADPGCTLVLNADDPSIAQLAEGTRAQVLTFGIDDRAAGLAQREHASDARFCRCGGRFAYEVTFMGHVGIWACTSCGDRRPNPRISARRVELGPDGSRVDVSIDGASVVLEIPMAGLYSVYNALAAMAAAHALGVPVTTIARAIGEAGPAFGRQERFEVDGRTVRVLLAKNPAGMNELLRALVAGSSEGQPVHLLAMLNDGIQDGQDVSWIYDADIEVLAGRDVTVTCSGDRADDFALRWHLAG
ncbi:MAG: DUF1727 domain-containing protein, partial [Dehalococcoidia bacterium]